LPASFAGRMQAIFVGGFAFVVGLAMLIAKRHRERG
jgi:hypothetical protein